MEQNKAERLNENVTEKMCSSDGNVVGEMCSPADADTCGDRGTIEEERAVEVSTRKLIRHWTVDMPGKSSVLEEKKIYYERTKRIKY